MINLKAYYEFEHSTKERMHCYKSVFEKPVEDVDAHDFYYDDPIAEAYIDVASRFGLDADQEASEFVWDKIYDEISDYIDRALIKYAIEYIEEENLVCYKVGQCSREGISFDDENLLCYSDAGLLYCILKSSGDEDLDKAKARDTAAYLAEIRDDVVADAEALMIEKEEYDI